VPREWHHTSHAPWDSVVAGWRGLGWGTGAISRLSAGWAPKETGLTWEQKPQSFTSLYKCVGL